MLASKTSPSSHGVSPVLGDVHGGGEGALELELGGLDGDDLKDGELGDELLGVLSVQANASRGSIWRPRGRVL